MSAEEGIPLLSWPASGWAEADKSRNHLHPVLIVYSETLAELGILPRDRTASPIEQTERQPRKREPSDPLFSTKTRNLPLASPLSSAVRFRARFRTHTAEQLSATVEQGVNGLWGSGLLILGFACLVAASAPG